MLETCSRARAVGRPDPHQIANKRDHNIGVFDWRLVAAGILILSFSAVAFAQLLRKTSPKRNLWSSKRLLQCWN